MVEIIQILQDAGGLLIWPICIVLLLLIMVQGGAGDISSAFGGGGQLDSSLGVGAQQKISKVTGWFTTLFLIIVVVLSIKITGGLGDFENPDAEANKNTSSTIDPKDPAAPGNQMPASSTDTDNSAEGSEAEKAEEGAEAGEEGGENEDAAAEGDNAAVEAVEDEPAEEANGNGGGEVEIEEVE